MRIKTLPIVCGILLVIAVSQVHAATPKLISYQGTLANAAGVPVSATVSITFSLYEVATAGSALWTETQSVVVSNGLFNVRLGDAQVLPLSVFEKDVLYLGIKVGADQEMTPRQQLTSAAFSQRAETVTVPVPIGAIIAWHKSMAQTPGLPAGWVECNGQVLNDPGSPFNSTTIPNLNGTSASPMFLRGGLSSGVVGGSTQHSHTLASEYTSRIFSYGVGGGNSWRSRLLIDAEAIGMTTADNVPPYFQVVWIMRVK